jgi:hypothetical protein
MTIQRKHILPLLLIIALVGLATAHLIQNRALRKAKALYQKELSALRIELGELNTQLSAFKNKSRADDLFIAGSTGDAMELYQALSSNWFPDTIADDRRLTFIHANEHRIAAARKMRALQQRLSKAESQGDSLRILADAVCEERDRAIVNSDSLSTNLAVIAYQLDMASKEREQMLSIIEIQKDSKVKVFYLGEKRNGKANGEGVGLWSTGGVYKGQWKDNLRHGKGHYTWKDGESYVGDFMNDQRTGEGKYIWKDGESYVGGWKDGRRSGWGTVYYPNGKFKYEGDWKDDTFIQPKKNGNGAVAGVDSTATQTPDSLAVPAGPVPRDSGPGQ